MFCVLPNARVLCTTESLHGALRGMHNASQLIPADHGVALHGYIYHKAFVELPGLAPLRAAADACLERS